MPSTPLPADALPAPQEELLAWAADRSREIGRRLSVGVDPDRFATLSKLQSAYDAAARAISSTKEVSNPAGFPLHHLGR